MIDITINSAVFLERLKQFPKDAHFAGVVALTKTAKIAQEFVKKSLQKEFVLKNTWTERGVRIRPAQKTDKEPYAEVFHKDAHIAQHEKGANRKISGEAFVPLAVREVFGISTTKIIPKSLRAKNIEKKKTVRGKRVFTSYSKAGKRGLFTIHNKQKRMLYISVFNPLKIDKEPWFFKAVEMAYDRNFRKQFDIAWDRYVKR